MIRRTMIIITSLTKTPVNGCLVKFSLNSLMLSHKNGDEGSEMSTEDGTVLRALWIGPHREKVP
jgi:hypothetical protein